MIWLILLLVPAALGLWALVVEPAMLRTTVYPVSLDNYPADAPPLKVALLTDLHTGSPFNGLDKLGKIVGETNAEKPDLILLGGDYVIHDILWIDDCGEYVKAKDITQYIMDNFVD